MGQAILRARQFGDLGTFLFVGRCHRDCQQLPQRVDRQMHFGAFALLVTIITGAGAALRRRLHRPSIKDRRTWLRVAPVDLAQQHAQVMHNLFEHPSRHPALRLLVHRVPRRQVIRHHPPCRTRPHNVAQAVEDLAQRVVALRSILLHQRQVRRRKRPFIVTYVARIGFSFHAPSLSYSVPQSA